MDKIREANKNEATALKIYASLRTMWNYAIEYFHENYDIILQKFPSKTIKPPKLNNKKTAYLEKDEAEKLLDLLYNWQDVCKVTVQTGTPCTHTKTC